MATGLLLLVLTQALLLVLDAATWVRVIAAVLVAVIGLASEVDKLHTKRLERAEAERAADEVAAAKEREWLRGAQDELRFWPVPPIDETPVVALGVKPELGRAAGVSGSGEAGPYVSRAIDDQGALRLRERGVVLLVGEPASGVTRTAAELAQTAGPARRVLAPRPPHGLRRSVNDLNVLDRLPPPVRLILWLDRIADYLPDGVTVPLLQRCQDASRGLRVVATIGSTSYLRWQAEQPELAAWFGEPVHLKRLPTPRERGAAEVLYPDRDFTHGVGAAFTGTGSLLSRRTGGNTECPFEASGSDCSLSRALIDVAVSWHASGTPRPLTKARAVHLAAQHAHCVTDNLDDHAAACIAWACQRVPEGVSLLTVNAADAGGTVLKVHPQLANILAAESEMDGAVWVAVLHDAAEAGDSDAIGRIGYAAHTTNHTDLAQQAWVSCPAFLGQWIYFDH